MTQSIYLRTSRSRHVSSQAGENADNTLGRKSCFAHVWTDSAIQPETPACLLGWNGTVYVGWERTGICLNSLGKKKSGRQRKALNRRAAASGQTGSYCHSWRIPIPTGQTLQDVMSSCPEMDVTWGRGEVATVGTGSGNEGTRSRLRAKRNSAHNAKIKEWDKEHPLPFQDVPAEWQWSDDEWQFLSKRLPGLARLFNGVYAQMDLAREREDWSAVTQWSIIERKMIDDINSHLLSR